MPQTPEERRAKKKAYYEAHRDERIAYQKARHAMRREDVKAYKAKWWAEQRPLHLAKKKAHYDANRDALLATARQRYAANPDLWKMRTKAYRVANPDTVRTAVVAWCKVNAVHLRAVKAKWQREDYKRNPERYKEIQGRRRAQKLRMQTERIDLKRILRESHGLCGICRKPLDLFGIDFDHIVPLARGGTHTTDNIQATHSYCNQVKGAKVG